MTENIKLHTDQRVTTMTIARPEKRNAITQDNTCNAWKITLGMGQFFMTLLWNSIDALQVGRFLRMYIGFTLLSIYTLLLLGLYFAANFAACRAARCTSSLRSCLHGRQRRFSINGLRRVGDLSQSGSERYG